MKIVKATRFKKMTYQDLSWFVHPRMSGMKAQIELRNEFIVSVSYLDIQQVDDPGFQCSYKHKNPTVQRCMEIENNPSYLPQRGLTLEEVDEYIQNIQKLPKPLVMQVKHVGSSL